MTAGLRALLTGIIDYAGLFPPAGLPLDQAIRNYARYRTEPESWMLGRFIIPAARLAELDPFMELFTNVPPLVISTLGRSGQDEPSFLDGLKQDLADVTAFRKKHGESVVIDVMETRIPREDAVKIVQAATKLIDSQRPPALKPFFEVLPADAKNFMTGVEGDGGLKLRCGGLEAAAFPLAKDIAQFIAVAKFAGTPLKFTAGLHHPIRRYDVGVKMHMHGFLNVFVAGVLANARGLAGDDMCRILDDEDASNFAFDADGLRWCDHHASVTEIETARRERVISFGSCSFDEPRDDLHALNFG